MHLPQVRGVLFAAAALLPFVVATHATAEDKWTEIRSPHFRVLTDGSSRSGRNVANEFEQMRSVFAARFANTRIESGAPLTIVAARDGSTFSKLEPAVWKKDGDRIAGEFHRGWEKQFAVIRLDTWTDANQVVIYHEYTHSILHANAHWLPIWLDEGMAEFYGYTRFQSNHIYVGAPSARMRALQGVSLIPISTMLNVDHRSPYYHDELKTQVFYAEAWAMVHYMIFGPAMASGEKLNTFFKLLQENVPQDKAFQQVFGDPAAFERGLSQYLQHFTLTAGVLPVDSSLDAKSFSERKLSEAEADYELGCFHIGAHDRAAGRALIERSLSLDAKLAGAHEELGYLDFDEGQNARAEQSWKEALALDASLPRSLFAITLSGAPISSQSPEQLRATLLALRHVTELAPRFAPAYVELALVEWRLGSMQAAYKDAHQAETLEPWRAGYRLLTARILLLGNQPALAAIASRYVATHWSGPDHNEAVDLWADVPPAAQGEGPAMLPEFPDGAKVIRGTIDKVTCDLHPGGGSISVSLTPSNAAPANPAKVNLTPVSGAARDQLTFTSTGHVQTGFSDTLWWGEDHFSICHHLEGHAGVVAYKPHGEGGGELIELEVREDLPSSSQTNVAKSPDAAAQPANP